MKQRASILDPFAAQLSDWDAANVPLAQMQQRLAEAGCAVAISRISTFLAAQRQRRMMDQVLGNIATGSRMNAEIEAAFAENPEPKLETLVSYYKRLILTLQVEGTLKPELLEIANAGFKHLMDFLKVEQKAAELSLSREKFEDMKTRLDSAREVVQSTLTPEEQRERLREILK